MKPARPNPIFTVLVGAVLALMLVAVAKADAPSAIARTAVATPHGQASLSSLKKEIASLNRRISALERSGAKLQAGAKPVGPAGGSLVGSYPNPTIGVGAVDRAQLATDAVASAQIANGSVFSQDIANGAIDPSKLAPSSVGSAALIDGAVSGADLANGAVDQSKLALQSVGGANLIDGAVGVAALAPGAVRGDRLGNALAVTGTPVSINPGQTAATTVTCPLGTRVLSGGFEWASTGRDGASVLGSGPSFAGNPNTDWAVEGESTREGRRTP